MGRRVYFLLLSGWVLVALQASTPEAGPAQPSTKAATPASSELAARVNNMSITRNAVRQKIAPSLREIGPALKQLRQDQIPVSISEKLMEEQASALGMDRARLFQDRVLSRVIQPTEEEALAFYNQHKQRFPWAFSEIKDKLISLLLQQRQNAKAKDYAAELRSKATVQVLARDTVLSSLEADPAMVVARVNEHPLTLREIDEAIAASIDQLQLKIYQLELVALNELIADALISQEATRRGVSPEALKAAEIQARIKPVSQRDIGEFLVKHKEDIAARWPQHAPAQREAEVRRQLEAGAAAEARAAFLARIQEGVVVQVLLTEPASPRYAIATEGQPVIGPEEAPVTIVQFIDYECSNCATLHEAITKLVKEFEPLVRCISLEYPLNQHPNAVKAAMAAEAAREQGRYWDYAGLLFENQTRLQTDDLLEYATRLGMDREGLAEALTQDRFWSEILRDRTEGQRVGVVSTPTVFINGLRLKDKSCAALKEAIQAALQTDPARR
jgi:protein-disulfide isomerase